MFVNSRTVLGLLAGVSILSACGGTAESAEEPRGASVPLAEGPAVVASEAPSAPAESAVTAPPPSASTRTERPAVVERPGPTRPVPEPAEPVVEPRAVAAGTTLTLALDQVLSTKSNKAGDPFSAHLVADLLAPDGEVLLPEGTVVRGTVTDAQESPAADVPAMLRLQIVDAQVGGEVLPMVADVEDMQLETEAKDSDRLTAGKVAVGVAAGALLSKALGKSGTKGAVAGAAAGAAVAVVTRDGHATLPQGAQMIIRLVAPLVIR